MSLKLRVLRGTTRRLRLQLSFEPESPVADLRWPGAILGALLLVWAGLLATQLAPVPYPWAPVIGPEQPVPDLPKPWPRSIDLSAARMLERTIPRGSTFAGDLRDAGVDARVVAEVVDAASVAIDPRRIRAGQPYRLYFGDDDRLLGLRYPVDRQTAWFVALDEEGWRVDKVIIPVQVRRAFLSAGIGSTLEGALIPHVRSRRDVHTLVSQIADIYGWDVDFTYDLQPGDRLDLLVEERWVEGDFIGYGDVLAAEFRVLGRTLPVVRFVDEDGDRSYFKPDGTSLRRAFLRSPVRYDRISSRFSRRRIHPVTGVARAHRGIDYVASPGTPVQATADGVVQEARYGAEPGRYVKIRHGGSYASIYMHLSRYAEGIAPGVAVEQGDIIGYVGKTGNTTGYHLHYGLIRAGQYVDPLQLQLPAAEPVALADRPAFERQRDTWLDGLRAGQTRIDVQVAGAGGL